MECAARHQVGNASLVKGFMDTFFAVTAPGLEPFSARELRTLFPDTEPVLQGTGGLPGDGNEGIRPLEGKPRNPAALHGLVVQPEFGGILFKGNLASLYQANLQLRTASRILARLGNFFYATTFSELHRHLARLPWERFLTPGQPVSIRATSHRSKLYHSDAVARTVATALEERLGQASPILKTGGESDHPAQLVVARLAEDKCTVSVDSSGSLLHKRGYRQAVAKAPLRETLAAALLMASGWDLSSPLLDPFCGSGTIPIEAALMALGMPPGINRRFAFMDWPSYDENLWKDTLARAQGRSGDPPLILASDRDAGAVKMAQANAVRAGVFDSIEFKCQAVSSITPPASHGWVVTNPPYGLRLSEGKDLRNLYAQFGNVLQRQCPGWNLSVLSSDRVLLGQMQVKMDTTLTLVNGGIRVLVGQGIVRHKQ
jgi:putative N6-adenine-specific DNA methylase